MSRLPGGKAAFAGALPHVLVVDNMSRDGWKWGAVLRRAGFRVAIAEDTWAGWNALDDHAYDLLVTSQDPTGRTGLDLIRKVRTVDERLPCILIWDGTAPDVAELARLLQPGAVLEKPVAISELLRVVRCQLRGGGVVSARADRAP